MNNIFKIIISIVTVIIVIVILYNINLNSEDITKFLNQSISNLKVYELLIIIICCNILFSNSK